jgi:hypothetical protein
MTKTRTQAAATEQELDPASYDDYTDDGDPPEIRDQNMKPPPDVISYAPYLITKRYVRTAKISQDRFMGAVNILQVGTNL